MIVQDLIRRVPVADFLEEYKNLEDIGDPAEAALFFFVFFAKLLEKEPVRGNQIILGYKAYDASEAKDYLDTSAFDLPEIEAFRPIPLFGNYDPVTLRMHVTNTWPAIPSRYPLPAEYAYEHLPREEILGMRLDEGNVADCSPAKMLSAIMYELTFFGYEEDDVQQEINRLKEAGEAVKILEALPEEELYKRAAESEAILSELGLKSQKSEKQRAEAQKAIQYENAVNYLRKYGMLVKYFERHNKK